MMKLTSLALAGFAVMLGASPALAAWTTTTNADGSVTLLGEGDEGRYIQLWCQRGNHHIAVLAHDGLNDVPTGTAQLEFAADTGSTWLSSAIFYRQSEGWIGLAYDRLTDIPAILDDIMGAQGNIAAAVIVPETNTRIAIVASAVGSSAAGRQFKTACYGS